MGALNFGLNPDDYGFDSQSDYGQSDPNDSFLDKARKALQARSLVAGDSMQGAPPDPVTIPRVKKETQDSSLLAQHPEAGKWLDFANQIGAVLANRRKSKYQKNHPTARVQYSQVPPGQFNARAKAIESETYKNEFDAAKENASIGEAEARINDSAMNRYMGRRTAEMGQMVPAMTRAAMRDPRAEKAPPVYQQKLDTLRQHPAYLEATPKERNAMELHVIGAEPKTPQNTADDYNRAYARFMGRYDAQKKTGGPGGGADAAEKDIADGARYMADIIHNDFVEPEKAADMALEYLRNKQKLRTSVGKNPTMTPDALNPPPPAGAGALPLGVPASPAGGSYQQPADTSRSLPAGMTSSQMFSVRREGAPVTTPGAGAQPRRNLGELPPDFQQKLGIYARRISSHPEDRARLKADLLATYGIDPDLYLETGR